jgi:hypothetical protein
MAKLTSKKRNALPDSAFAGPDRSYPVEDKSHARNAKARASEMEHKGKISMATEKKIDAKADRVLGKKGGAKSAGVMGKGIGHPHHSGMNASGHKHVRNPESHAEKLKHC